MSTKSKRSVAQHVELMRNAMEKHKLSITDLAVRVGITRSYASLVYNGKRSPSPKLLRALEKLERMPSIYDLEDDGVKLFVNENRTNSKGEYMGMSHDELEKAILEYAKELHSGIGAKKIITLTVLKDLVCTLLGKVNA